MEEEQGREVSNAGDIVGLPVCHSLLEISFVAHPLCSPSTREHTCELSRSYP